MKTPRQTSKQIPGWQAERAKILHRACQSIKAAIGRGESLGRVIQRTARRLDGRPYRCQPTRRLALSPKSLRRHWDAWRHNGELPLAFKMNFKSHRQFIPAPVFARFAQFCAAGRHRSLASAWRKFFIRNRRARKPLQISDYLVRQYFPAAQFYQLQAELKNIEAAQIRKAKLLLAAIAEIRRRLPDRPPRQYQKRVINFEI